MIKVDHKNFYNTGGLERYHGHDLTEDSIIFEIGGYTGSFVDEMIKRYNPHIFIVEPIEKYYDILKSKYLDNEKVKILKVGVSTAPGKSIIYHNTDASSRHIVTTSEEEIDLVTIKYLLDFWNLKEVDLLQINIEGDEYDLLDHMLDTKIVDHFKTIQIQFHLIGDDPITRRTTIQNNLKDNGFNMKYNYDFIWEAWTRI
jgi:FkbM family methyltransferase